MEGINNASLCVSKYISLDVCLEQKSSNEEFTFPTCAHCKSENSNYKVGGTLSMPTKNSEENLLLKISFWTKSENLLSNSAERFKIHKHTDHIL